MKKYVIILLIMLFSPLMTIEAYEDFVITSYNVDINVLKNNVLEITEDIDVRFNEERHGIYRSIPLKNTVIRNDGSVEHNRAIIKDININESFTKNRDNGYLILKIGNAYETVIGDKKYIIRYNYDLGKDRNKSYDELYFNMIGDKWTTNIEKVTFSINMPKQFDPSKIGFSVGSKGSIGYDENQLVYNVDGQTIKGQYNGGLNAYEGITIRLELPEGYFEVSDRSGVFTILLYLFSILGVVISFILWLKFGNNKKLIKPVEFYPPENLNSLEISVIYKNKVTKKGVLSLLVYLANKGYLKIEEYEKKTFFIKHKAFRIIKLKEYDGNNNYERYFFESLFDEEAKQIEEKTLSTRFYATITSLLRFIKYNSTMKPINEYHPNLRTVIKWIISVIIIFMIISPLYEYYGYFNIHLLSYFKALQYNTVSLVGIIVAFVSIGIMIFFYIVMPNKTDYGYQIVGRVLGFREFLKVAEKDKLEALVNDNPSYFYDILPYAYVLGVSNKWVKKLEGIAKEPPNWYQPLDTFDIYHFCDFVDYTLKRSESVIDYQKTRQSINGVKSILKDMVVGALSFDGSSDSSSGGGGYSGGGSSGGGSGGGGGGSW